MTPTPDFQRTFSFDTTALLPGSATFLKLATTTAHDVILALSANQPFPDHAIVTNGATYSLGAVPAAACTSQDPLSGVALPAVFSRTGGNAEGVGTFTASCGSARDAAGNLSTPFSLNPAVQTAPWAWATQCSKARRESKVNTFWVRCGAVAAANEDGPLLAPWVRQLPDLGSV